MSFEGESESSFLEGNFSCWVIEFITLLIAAEVLNFGGHFSANYGHAG